MPFNTFENRADPDQAVLQELPGSALFAYGNVIRYNPTLVDLSLTSNFLILIQKWTFIYIIIHSGWSLAWMFKKQRANKFHSHILTDLFVATSEKGYRTVPRRCWSLDRTCPDSRTVWCAGGAVSIRHCNSYIEGEGRGWCPTGDSQQCCSTTLQTRKPPGC